MPTNAPAPELPALDPHSLLTYLLDPDDRIIDVGPTWDDFARLNDGADAMKKDVLNRPLTDFISGAEVKYLVTTLLATVRKRKVPLKVSFRCDAPNYRRYMTVNLSSTLSGAVLVETQLEREVPREALLLLDRNVERSDEQIIFCAWCNRANIEGVWVEIDVAIQTLDLFSKTHVPSLSHGICPDCIAVVEAL